jgi:hypothetical protein
MPYEMYRYLLYVVANSLLEHDSDYREIHERVYGFCDDLGAEGLHQFLAENRGFMNRWRELLEAGSNDIKTLLERVNFPLQP